MPDPMSLKSVATMVCMRVLLKENPTETSDENKNVAIEKGTQIKPYLTKLLQTDCFTAVSEEILYRILKFCPQHLTDSLLVALSPVYTTNLNVKDCTNVHLDGLVKVLQKCCHVNKINLSRCSQLICPDIFTFIGLSQIPVTTVIVEDNNNVNDEVVHEMLRRLPYLHTLSISSCDNVTDNVFLLDENKQIHREFSLKAIRDEEYSCNLTSVDVSGCSRLTSGAIRHLTSLCGPKLTDVNISGTDVNCTALLHLAGYSIYAMLNFMHTNDSIASDQKLCKMFHEWTELLKLYRNLERTSESFTKNDTRDLVNDMCNTVNDSGDIVNDSGVIIMNNTGDTVNDTDDTGELITHESETCHDALVKNNVDTEEYLYGKTNDVRDFSTNGELSNVPNEKEVELKDERVNTEHIITSNGSGSIAICAFESFPKTISEEVNKAMVDDIINDIADMNVDETADNMANDIADGMAVNLADAMADEMAVAMANEMADAIANEMADAMANEMADAIANEMADAMANEMADAMANEMADEMANNIADGMADDIADEVADNAVDETADNMADNMFKGLDKMTTLGACGNGLCETLDAWENKEHDESGRNNESSDRIMHYCKGHVRVSKEQCYGDGRLDRNDEEDLGCFDIDEEIERVAKESVMEREHKVQAEADLETPVKTDELGSCKFLFKSKIVKLNIKGIKFVSTEPYLGQLCLEKFLAVNDKLQKFAVSWKGLTFDVFKTIAPELSQLIEVELVDCSFLTSAGVRALGLNCRKCKSINLRGVVFITNNGLVPFLANKNLQVLSLAESDQITDDIIVKFSELLYTSLTNLDLSYCEEVSEKGINAICSTCTQLKKLQLHKCQVSDFSLRLLSKTAPDLVEISVENAKISNEESLTDEGILTMANSLRHLRILNISWNLDITDMSISAILMNCNLLEEAILTGLKRTTIQPFLPIIADFENEKSCEHKTRERSTVYAPNLRVLDLYYNDLVDDNLLQEIVNVCRGTLEITDYYGTVLEPENM